MYLYRSNSNEVLAAALAKLLERPLSDPFLPERIVVPNGSWENWLTTQLAQHRSVVANHVFGPLRPLIEEAVTWTSSDETQRPSDFQPETSSWAIAQLLLLHRDDPRFELFQAFSLDPSKLHSLLRVAREIAEVFDHYQVYRPELLQRWAQGGGTDWQATLWKMLIDELGHDGPLGSPASELLRDIRAVPDTFPQQVTIIGYSTLPPLFLQILDKVSVHSQIHLFIQSPTKEYWADLGPKEKEPLSLFDTETWAALGDEAQAATDKTHPLLGGLGRVGRDMQISLEENSNYIEPDVELYHSPSAQTDLQQLQRDLVSFDSDTGRKSKPHLDRSIQIHCCHGPIREVQVLLDEVTRILESNTNLAPRDVAVYCPNLDTYQPYIEAVFGTQQDSAKSIPFHIESSRSVEDAPSTFAFLSLLEILPTRLAVPRVLDVLNVAPVRLRFDLSEDEIPIIRDWLEQAAVRWGIHGANRETFEQPPLDQNTWKLGIDRLLLGYAMGDDAGLEFNGVAPVGGIEGTQSETLSKLVSFADTVARWHTLLRQPKPIAVWCELLPNMIKDLIDFTDVNPFHRQALLSAISGIGEQAARGSFEFPVQLADLVPALRGALASSSRRAGLARPGVMFRKLTPMQVTPSEVVAFLGLNEQDYPRKRQSPRYDLISAHPKVGDRNARDDDRYLFIESLITPSTSLLATYTGIDQASNERTRPSAVVCDLLDELHAKYNLPLDAEEAYRDSPWVYLHPVLEYDQVYFDHDSPLRSFSRHAYNCGRSAARSAETERKRGSAKSKNAALVFRAPDLAIGESPPRNFKLNDLVRFFRNPSRDWGKGYLGVTLQRDTPNLADREILECDSLELYQLGSDVIASLQRGASIDDSLALARTSGKLPIGALGVELFHTMLPQIMSLVETSNLLAQGHEATEHSVRLHSGNFRVDGKLHGIFPTGLIRTSYSKPERGSELDTWIEHLTLGSAKAQAKSDPPSASNLVVRSAKSQRATVIRFRSPTNPLEQLRRLLQLAALGDDRPLPFFRKSSRAYASNYLKTSSDELALVAARKEFSDTAGGITTAESDDPYIQLAFRGIDPFTIPSPSAPPPDDSKDSTGSSNTMGLFAELSLAIFGPLLSYREEVS